MLLCRSLRRPTVGLAPRGWPSRQLATISSRGQDTTIMASTSASTQQPCSSVGPDLASLPISLPDLASFEVKYIRKQLDLICKLAPSDLVRTKMETAAHKVNTYFPKASLCKKHYNVIREHARNPIWAERTLLALKELGINDEEVSSNPAVLAYPFLRLPQDMQVKMALDVPLVRVSKARGKTPLRGLVIRDVLRELQSSLASLTLMENAEQKVSVAQMGVEPRGGMTFDILNKRAIAGILQNVFGREDDAFKELMKIVQSQEACKGKNVIDAKAMARNIWLLSHLIKLDIADRRTLKHVVGLCPLETLITLNMYYAFLNEDLQTTLSVSDFARIMASTSLQAIFMPSLKFPLTVRKQLLLDIGFVPAEAKEIVLSKTSFKDEGKGLRYTSSEYVSEMKRRLQVLRPNSNRLGATHASQLFSAVTRWNELLSKVKALSEGNRQSSCLRLDSKSSIVSEVAFNGAQCNLPVTRYLFQLFDCTTSDKRDALTRDAIVSKASMRIPLERIAQSFSLLTQRGFSLAQIRRAVPLLYYPSALIEQKLEEMRETKEVAGVAEDSQHYLHICLFLIEKELDYAIDGILSSVTSLDFTPELYSEMAEKLGYERPLSRAQRPVPRMPPATPAASSASRVSHAGPTSLVGHPRFLEPSKANNALKQQMRQFSEE